MQEVCHKKEFCLYGAKNMILTVSIDWEENDFWGREQVFFFKTLAIQTFLREKVQKNAQRHYIFPCESIELT